MLDNQTYIFTFIHEVPIFWMKLSSGDIENEFKKVFIEADDKLLSHYVNKWDGDFAHFWFNMDKKMLNQMFKYYMPEKPDDETIALIRKFYLLSSNYSLELLDDILQYNFTEKLIKNKIKLFGNGYNWSMAYCLLNPSERILFFRYLSTVENI